MELFVRPTLGDIVIWRQSPGVFYVSRFPGPYQFSCASITEAIATARRVVRATNQARVLYTRNGVRFEKI